MNVDMKHCCVLWIYTYVLMLHSAHGSPNINTDISSSNSSYSYLQNSNDSDFESETQTVKQDQNNNYTQSSNVVTETILTIIPSEAECNSDDCFSKVPSTNILPLSSSTIKQNLSTATTLASNHHSDVSDGKKLTETDDSNSASPHDFSLKTFRNYSNSNLSLSHNSTGIDYEIALFQYNELDSEIRNDDNTFTTINSIVSFDGNSSDVFSETAPWDKNVTDSLNFETFFEDRVTTVQSFTDVEEAENFMNFHDLKISFNGSSNSALEENKTTIPDDSMVNEVKFYKATSDLWNSLSPTPVPQSSDASLFPNEIENNTSADMSQKPEISSSYSTLMQIALTTSKSLLHELEDNEISATNFHILSSSISTDADETSVVETYTDHDTSSDAFVMAERDYSIPSVTTTPETTPTSVKIGTSTQLSYRSQFTENLDLSTFKEFTGTHGTIQNTFETSDIELETYTNTFSTTERHVNTRTDPSIPQVPSSHDVFHTELINIRTDNSSDHAVAKASSFDFANSSTSTMLNEFSNVSTATSYTIHDLSFHNLQSTATSLESTNPELANSKAMSINDILEENFTSAILYTNTPIQDIDSMHTDDISSNLTFPSVTFKNHSIDTNITLPNVENSSAFPFSDHKSTQGFTVNASIKFPHLTTFGNMPSFTPESVPDNTTEQKLLSSTLNVDQFKDLTMQSVINSTELTAQTVTSSTDFSTMIDSISDHTGDISITTEEKENVLTTIKIVEQHFPSSTLSIEKDGETLQSTASSADFSTRIAFSSDQSSEQSRTTDENKNIFTATDELEQHFSVSTSNTERYRKIEQSSASSADFTTMIAPISDHKDEASERTEANTFITSTLLQKITSYPITEPTEKFVVTTHTPTAEIYKESESTKNILNATTFFYGIISSSTIKSGQIFEVTTHSTTAETHREGKHINFSSTRTKSDTTSSTDTRTTSVTPTELQTTQMAIELLYSQIKVEDLSLEESNNMITAVTQLPHQNYSQEEIEEKLIIFHHWLLHIMTESFNISMNSSNTTNYHSIDRTEGIPQILYVFPTPKMKFSNITFTFIVHHPWKNGTLPYNLLLPILKLHCDNLKDLMNASAADFFHVIPNENLDFLSVVMEKYGTIVFIICVTTVGTVVLLICVVIYHRRKTRQSAHYLTDNKLHRNIQEAVGIDLNPAVLILQDEVREKSALNGNKICSLEDDEGWLAPYGDVPIAEDTQAPVVQDTKL